MSGSITIVWRGDGLPRLSKGVDGLSRTSQSTAIAGAMNQVGDTASRQVKSALVTQMGLPNLLANGRTLTSQRASAGRLTYVIQSGGRAARGREFPWTQTGSGLVFHPWGRAHYVNAAFQVPRWGGNLYRRTGASRFPIKGLYGGNINKELVKDQSAATFRASVASQLPRRVDAALVQASGGVLS